MKHHAVKLPSRATPSSSAMGAHKFSRAIAKAPPRKIRIVHVLAPEVIKTDARHFRDLVQRLTGKPAADGIAASASQPGSCDTARDVGTVLTDGTRGAATIKAEMKVEEAEAEGPAGGFLRSPEEEDNNGVFLQWLEDNMEDLIFSSEMDAVSF